MIEVVAALIWNGDRFLACQRPAGKARALLWEFVGGKVEPGETRQQALVRECKEELDITVAVGDVFVELVHQYPDITVRLILFHCTILQGEPRLLEHNDLKWITTEQIDAYDFCPADKDILTLLKKLRTQLRARLYSLGDEAYKAFHGSLMPTFSKEKLFGVRMPVLRKIAKQISFDTLGLPPFASYEESCLYAIKINELTDVDDAIYRLKHFLPHVDNWAVCDLLNPKAFKTHSGKLLCFIDTLLCDHHPYTVRFAIGQLMRNYLDAHFSADIIVRVNKVVHNDYYVKMMIAWFFATALYKQYSAAVTYLQAGLPDIWVHNKAIQKAIESNRITCEQKTYLRSLKKGCYNDLS